MVDVRLDVSSSPQHHVHGIVLMLRMLAAVFAVPSPLAMASAQAALHEGGVAGVAAGGEEMLRRRGEA